MARLVPAPITPAVLRWARESAGMSVGDLAQRLRVPDQKVVAWEAGQSKPYLGQVDAIATALRRPSAVFYLLQPPEEPGLPADFRRMSASEPPTWSRELRLFLRYARRRQEWASEQRRDLGCPPVEWMGSRSALLRDVDWGEAEALSTLAKATAAELRRVLAVSLPTQTAWHSAAVAFANWRAAVEARGVLVFQSGIRPEWVVPVEEMRGLALADPHAPLIALNGGDSHTARTFSLMHEMAHLLGGAAGLSGSIDLSAPANQSLERWCNAVAAVALVPDAPLVAAAQRHGWREPTALTIEHHGLLLRALARDFGVSREVIARRLNDTGLAPSTFYTRQLERLQAEWLRGRPTGGPPPAVVAVARHGRAFVRLALEALAEDRLSLAEAQDLLGISLTQLPRLEELVHAAPESRAALESAVA